MEKTKKSNDNETRRMAEKRSCENDEMMDPELIEDILIFAEMACREEIERSKNMKKKIIAIGAVLTAVVGAAVIVFVKIGGRSRNGETYT